MLPVCGNSIIQTGEVCDDGNLLNGDGCSSTCQIEAVPAGGGGGGGAPLPYSEPPRIAITKTPSRMSIPNCPGTITYSYNVTNTGPLTMNMIQVSDDRCSSVNYISGDTDSDSNLDLTETWQYQCTDTLAQTTTNVATVTGQAGGKIATDSAEATVICSIDPTPVVVVPPSVVVPPIIVPPVVVPPVVALPIVAPTVVITPPSTVVTPVVKVTSVIKSPKLPNTGNGPNLDTNSMKFILLVLSILSLAGIFVFHKKYLK